MQTRQQTWFEVGIDVILSLLVNIVAQSLVYGALATVSRSVTFASLVLGLATLRRYATRRLFNAKLLTDGPQSRLQSWLEVSTDTAIGLIVAILLQGIFYGAAATWSKAGGLTTVVYAIALGRRYLLRRFFETWNTRQRAQSLYRQQLSS